jgi:hypothetical protein
MSETGALAGGVIGIAWVVLAVWMVRTGQRLRSAAAWTPATGTIVGEGGSTEGLILHHPHVRYADADGEVRVVSLGAKGTWPVGADVDVLVDPTDPTAVMPLARAERGQPYIVIGWFIGVVGFLTLVGAALLAVAVPH